MRLVGVIGSGSTTTYAPLLVYETNETLAKEEQLVIVDDRRRNMKYLGVIRRVHRYEPFLDPKRRTSYVDNPNLVDHGVMPHTSAWVTLIGSIITGSIGDVQLPPNPGSYVYVIESPKDLELGIDVNKSLIIGRHKYSGIEVPLDPSALPMHTIVVGATGTGKSRLVKALTDEILAKTDYSVIIFDHTGMDYVPYYRDKVIEASKIVLDPILITDLMIERADLDARYEQYILPAVLMYMTQAINVDNESRSTMRLSERSYSVYDLDMLASIDMNKLMSDVASKAIEWKLEKFKELAIDLAHRMAGSQRRSVELRLSIAIDIKLGKSFFRMLSNRDLLPNAIIDKLRKEKLIVIDLSTEDILIRRYVVASIISSIWKIIESERKKVNIIAVIDEAHNYACRYCGEPHKEISRVAREGRKWGFGLVLATQRMVDIDPEIRGNVNTVIFSKLQTPSDFNEISAYMDLAGLTEASLAILSKREFFIAGLMNTLRVPILIKVKEVMSPV